MSSTDFVAHPVHSLLRTSTRVICLLFSDVRLTLFILVFALFGTTSQATVRLPRLVADNMVLQRDTRMTVWGWADPGERVTVNFQGQYGAVAADSQGRWSLTLGPFSAGGPYQMTIKGKNTLSLHNILVGDVWLASGQSNMEFPVRASGEWRTGIDNAEVEIARAHYPSIRLFVVQHHAATKPVEEVSADGWQAVTPRSVGNFSAVAYLFGRELHERYAVPIGIIESTWGGTVAEAWMSPSALESFPEFRSQVESLARLDDRDRRAYEAYRERKEEWYRRHRLQDQGRARGRNLWADPSFSTEGWPTLTVPRPEAALGKDINGFDGVVWFRREIYVPPRLAGRTAQLTIGLAIREVETYFNGEKLGGATGDADHPYVIPARYVSAGRNVIAVRLVGAHHPDNPDDSGVGLFGPAEKMRLAVGGESIPLAGVWTYHPGAQLRDYPIEPPEITAAEPRPSTPTELFNGMIHPLLNFKLKGVIWYQGESNAMARRAIQYRALFPALIEDWRREWRADLPFLFVQLAGFGPEQAEGADCQWAELREAQAMALSLPGTGMATAIDLGDAQDIHPRNKQAVAHRLALVAAKVVYGESVVDSGPTFQSAQLEGDHLRIHFSNLGTGLSIRDKYGYIRGFELAGEDYRFEWAKAEADGADILVFSEGIQHPAAVRYDWANTPDGNVFNREGLPALPFRSSLSSQSALSKTDSLQSR